MLANFKVGVAAFLPDEDGDSHAHLAEAYRALGLYQDAVREASSALKGGRRGPIILSALEMLLSPPLLRSDDFVRLRNLVRT